MLRYTHEYYMRMAIKQAQQAFEMDEVPIGAVIVIDDKVVAKAHNQVELLNDPTAHAEILAITAACSKMGAKYLTAATLYVTIEPCLMCSGAIYWGQLQRIVYGAQDLKNGFRKYVHSDKPNGVGVAPFHVKSELISGILQEECAQLLKDFFKARR